MEAGKEVDYTSSLLLGSSLAVRHFVGLPDLSPEFQLLCACCRVTPREEDLVRQEQLASEIEGEALLRLADRHRVAPLLYHNLRRHPKGRFPDRVMQALEGALRRNSFQALHDLALNLRLSRLLEDAGIPFLPLKGVTLAARYYGELGIRHVNDVDFWIPPESVGAAGRLFKAQGWLFPPDSNIGELRERGPNHEKFVLAYDHHDVVITPENKRLELHWRLSDNDRGLKLDMSAVLASAEPLAAGQEKLPVMGPVPLLLYLCTHGARHGWCRLKWLMDLPQILESRNWDWCEVLRAADAAGCRASLLTSLALVHQLFRWELPREISAALTDDRFVSWRLTLIWQLLSASVSWSADSGSNPFAARIRFDAYLVTLAQDLSSIREELRLSGLSPNDVRLFPLPDRCFHFYWFLRPLLFAWRYMIRPRAGSKLL